MPRKKRHTYVCIWNCLLDDGLTSPACEWERVGVCKCVKTLLGWLNPEVKGQRTTTTNWFRPHAHCRRAMFTCVRQRSLDMGWPVFPRWHGSDGRYFMCSVVVFAKIRYLCRCLIMPLNFFLHRTPGKLNPNTGVSYCDEMQVINMKWENAMGLIFI